MSEIHEAPIIHGNISVSAFSTKHIAFNTTSFNKIDTTIDVSSQNPVSNSATKSSLDVTKSPVVSAFHFKLVKTTNVSSVGQIYFDYVAQEINTFGNGGTVNGTLIVPTSGTYLISSNTTATTQSNSLEINLKLNNTDIDNVSKNGVLIMSTMMFVNSGDVISLHSSNNTQSLTSLEVTLIKPDQTM